MSSARWQPGLATFAYVGAIFVFFALCKPTMLDRLGQLSQTDHLCWFAAVTQIGLAGHQLKIYEYHISGWDNHHQLKSIIGLVLWTSILGTIFSITAFFLPAFVALVSLFVLSFFWIICAGVLQHAMPYRPGNCHRKPEFDHARFDRSCHQLAAMMVLSWWQWVWVSIFLVAFAVHFVRGSAENRPKRTVFGA